jgi:ADP-ribose pyrophosphatase
MFAAKYAPKRVRKWARKDPEVVADFGIFRVHRSKLETPEGISERAVHTMEVRDWCNVLPITADGHAVLIWQYRFGSDALSLEIPGGVIDPGESPEHAALRELEEESGYRSKRLQLLSVLEPNPAFQDNRIYSYVAFDCEPTGRTNFDELEDCETVRVPVAELPQLLDDGVVTHALCAMVIDRFLRRRPT